jgi:hypothetical protein
MDEMYSVIIPTLWVPDFIKFKKLINEVNDHPLVKEILLIDNAPDFDENVKSFILDDIDKLIHFRMDKNIYVNPAWNLGVKNSTATFIILLNDDFFTDVGVNKLIDLHNVHPNKDEALYGISDECYSNYYATPEEYIFNESPVIDIDGSKLGGTGWACFVILPKKNYPVIPNELKIWFGDNIILLYYINNKLPLYAFKNFKVENYSTTLNKFAPEIDKIIEMDRDFFSKI